MSVGLTDADPRPNSSTSHRAWTGRAWPSLGPLYWTTPTEPFAQSSLIARIGPIVIYRADFSAQRWERNAEMVAANDPRSLFTIINLTGHARGHMGDRFFDQPAGTALFSDMSQTSMHDSSATTTIAVSIPNELAQAHDIDPGDMHGRVASSPAVSLLAEYLKGAHQAAAAIAASDEPLLVRSIINLLTVVANEAGRQRAAVKTVQATFGAVVAAIERRLADPALSIDALCEEFGVSRSTLHRMFTTEGGVGAHIRARRLEAVRAVLTDPTNHEPLYEVAERFGFSDGTHLSRLFRGRYGQAPSAYRQRPREG